MELNDKLIISKKINYQEEYCSVNDKNVGELVDKINANDFSPNIDNISFNGEIPNFKLPKYQKENNFGIITRYILKNSQNKDESIEIKLEDVENVHMLGHSREDGIMVNLTYEGKDGRKGVEFIEETKKIIADFYTPS